MGKIYRTIVKNIKRTLTLGLAAAASVVVILPATANATAESTINSSLGDLKLKAYLAKIIKDNERAGANTAVQVVDLNKDRPIVSHQATEKHFAASINKNPIALLLLQELRAGNLDFNQVISWDESERRGGYGVYDQAGAATQATVKDLMFDMLNYSGNTAARVFVIKSLGGATTVNQRWAQIPELSNTSLLTVGTSGGFYFGYSNPRESLWALRNITSGSDQYAKFIRNALSTNIFDFMGVRSQLNGNDYIVLTNKVGIVDTSTNDPDGNNRHDVGIILNKKTGAAYGYSFMITSPPGFPEDGNNYEATLRADQSLKDMGRRLLDRAGDRPLQATGQENTQLFNVISEYPVPVKELL